MENIKLEAIQIEDKTEDDIEEMKIIQNELNIIEEDLEKNITELAEIPIKIIIEDSLAKSFKLRVEDSLSKSLKIEKCSENLLVYKNEEISKTNRLRCEYSLDKSLILNKETECLYRQTKIIAENNIRVREEEYEHRRRRITYEDSLSKHFVEPFTEETKVLNVNTKPVEFNSLINTNEENRKSSEPNELDNIRANIESFADATESLDCNKTSKEESKESKDGKY